MEGKEPTYLQIYTNLRRGCQCCHLSLTYLRKLQGKPEWLITVIILTALLLQGFTGEQSFSQIDTKLNIYVCYCCYYFLRLEGLLWHYTRCIRIMLSKNEEGENKVNTPHRNKKRQKATTIIPNTSKPALHNVYYSEHTYKNATRK